MATSFLDIIFFIKMLCWAEDFRKNGPLSEDYKDNKYMSYVVLAFGLCKAL